MNYIDYFSLLPIDSIILTDKKYHHFRVLYRKYKLMGRYLNSAIMQYNRIEEWARKQKELGSRKVKGIDMLESEQVITDIHFLLLAMDKCNKMQVSLYYSLFGNNEGFSFSHSEYTTTIRKMRNILEHMDENIGNDSKNTKYNLEQIYKDNGWSWLEFQLLSLHKGKFALGNYTLEFSTEMFNDSIIGLNRVADELTKQTNNLK